MPYTPPSQRSPGASTSSTPVSSRRSSSHSNHPPVAPVHSHKLELPRSTSYLTRHRRTPSVKDASLTPEPELDRPTPLGEAESEGNELDRRKTTGSLRQSPPPVTDDNSIPTGALLSPPDSLQNSSDDEEPDKLSGRELDNLAELQAAIRGFEHHRESSQANNSKHGNQPLTLVMPTQSADIKSIGNVGKALSNTARKISHSRSNTESSVFIDFRQAQQETPTTGSEEERYSDDEQDRSRRKPPMLRKKSGELVRPALRASSARRRPSSMPGTPTFSKAVHFDSHLEHVRHFLQVDRPLAVSANSSPVESYDSDVEFPFSDVDSRNRNTLFELEIVLPNFPPETPQRLQQVVRVEQVFLSSDNKTLIGSVAVANLAYAKIVIARFTLDYWKTTSEVVAEYNHDVRRKKQANGYDRFNFNIRLDDLANLETKTMFFCVKYCVNGMVYWDNNNSTNFQVDFKKKAKPQNGKNVVRLAANGLPRNPRNLSNAPRPKSMPITSDDFAEGFDFKYDFKDFAKQAVDEYLGGSEPVRLKGVKSAVTLASDNLTKLTPSPHGQAFANRYDFSASLSAAIQAANSTLGDRNGTAMKPSKKHAPQMAVPVESTREDAPPAIVTSSATGSSPSGNDSPRSASMGKPILSSDSYNELLDKYCFFGSTRNSSQPKSGSLSSRPGQYDGNDEGYALDSQSSTLSSSGSPIQAEISPLSYGNAQGAQSISSAPMTGLVTGTSPMYLYNVNAYGGFSFNEAHTPTAIQANATPAAYPSKSTAAESSVYPSSPVLYTQRTEPAQSSSDSSASMLNLQDTQPMQPSWYSPLTPTYYEDSGYYYCLLSDGEKIYRNDGKH